ncbi:MAG: N-acetyltransferase [Campylobacterales bacterium]
MALTYEKPTLKDIPAMQALVEPEVANGLILRRDVNEMAQTIRSYTIAKDKDELVGFAALNIYSPKLAEVRSLVVGRAWRGRGVGSELVRRLEEEGRRLGLEMILVLTYHRTLFEKLGFEEIPKEQIPEQKIWADCIKCPHFPVCNEISLIKKL